MSSKYLFFMLSLIVTVLFVTPAVCQDSASMTPPIVKTAEGQVVITSRFENFVAGSQYRLGIGIAGEAAPDAKVELLKSGTPVSKESSAFVQKNTSHWWGVEQLQAKGFSLSPADLPQKGQRLTFRITISREKADALKKLYIFVSRDYGSSTWYLEDGVELNEKYW